jgi:hypothetical protein
MIRAAILTAGLLASSAAFAAQDDRGAGTPTDPKINTVIVFGDDACPESTEDQINVCAILVEGDRYRIPASLRDDPNDPRKQSWTQRVIGYRYVGRDGTMSCSASGAGGFTGCGLREIESAYKEADTDPSLAFGRMIAEERRKRMEGVDAEAAEVEARVVQFEKERAEKEAREANTPPPPEDDSSDLPQPK